MWLPLIAFPAMEISAPVSVHRLIFETQGGDVQIMNDQVGFAIEQALTLPKRTN